MKLRLFYYYSNDSSFKSGINLYYYLVWSRAVGVLLVSLLLTGDEGVLLVSLLLIGEEAVSPLSPALQIVDLCFLWLLAIIQFGCKFFHID